MPIVPCPRWGELSSWGLWLIVVLVMLLSPWRTSRSGMSSQSVLVPAASGPVEPVAVWQSPYAAVPWFSRALRARWQWAWYTAAKDAKKIFYRNRSGVIARIPYRSGAVCLKKETRVVRSDDFSHLRGQSDSSRYYEREFPSSV